MVEISVKCIHPAIGRNVFCECEMVKNSMQPCGLFVKWQVETSKK